MYISREEAIKILNTMVLATQVKDVPLGDIEEVREALLMAISVLSDKERPQGEWVQVTPYNLEEQIFICSRCHRDIKISKSSIGLLYIKYPFCHCGADMRGGNEITN